MAFADRLPVDDYQAAIERAVRANPVVIVSAETGAGKSTRIPYWFFGKGKSVHVTQPRRIAARALSYYLSQVCHSSWGREIGYQTGFESKKSPATTLLYLTDGVQMVQEIQGSRGYDLLVLDEIHEWNLNQEVLVGMVLANLRSGYYRRSGQRVLIMSATFKAKQLSAFLDHAPVISIPGREYPVSLNRHHPQFLLADTVELVEQGRNILVFQPGKAEIEEFSLSLRRALAEDNQQAVVLPLHSELSIREQGKVFQKFPLPKVVVATDIAQTSLTIDDIDAVVDTGQKKEIRLVNGIEGLYLCEISSAECLQRAGRAGRVKPGVYCLCSEQDIKDRPEYPEPEIRRLNLESVALRMFKWGLSPTDFVFFHRPKHNLLVGAVANLIRFGALSAERRITADGRRMADFPVSLRSSRLLLEAEKGGTRVTNLALRVIAILEVKGIVNKEYQGEPLAGLPYLSDLLHQLFLWEEAGKHKQILSGKKIALAQEIHQELRRRLQVPPGRGQVSASDLRALFRAILSSFIDHVYIRSNGTWRQGDEERQLERTSVLYPAKPEMLVGLPFDLMTVLRDAHTGKEEQFLLPLITFASSFSLALLAELQPFGYERQEEMEIVSDRIQLRDRIHFGSLQELRVDKAPDWKNARLRQAMARLALSWFESNRDILPWKEEIEKCRCWWQEIPALVKETPEPFAAALQRFILRETSKSLNTLDLKAFFGQHPPFLALRLDNLLPRSLLRRMRELHWPAFLESAGQTLPIFYGKNRSYLQTTPEQFKELKATDLRLPSGEQAGIMLRGRLLSGWAEAVAFYNDLQREEIFARKWQGEKKPASHRDIADLPFPVSFIGGYGKEKVPFEFFSVPTVEKDELFLIHFRSHKEAAAHYERMKRQVEELLRRQKKEEVEAVFRQKGWTVKK